MLVRSLALVAFAILPIPSCNFANQTTLPDPTNISITSSTPTLSANLVSSAMRSSSSAIAVSPDGRVAVAVNPDSGTVTVVEVSTLQTLGEISTGSDPRTLAITPDSHLAVIANHGDATVSVIDLNVLVNNATIRVGSMPYGVVTNGSYVFVAELAAGNIGIYNMITGEDIFSIAVAPFPAGLALSNEGETLYVSHLHSGQVTIINLQTLAVVSTASTGSDSNLSQSITLTPDGTKAYLPQTRSNVTVVARTFDSTVFPVVNVLDLQTQTLLSRERITLDTADRPVNMPFETKFSPTGDTLYVANAGSNDISVIDLSTNLSRGNIEVGANPRGLAITPDGALLFVNNVLEGTLSVVDTANLRTINTVPITKIPLNPQELLGKQLFNSAASPVLTTDNWLSCATCHFDGRTDARTWLNFPDGSRNTPALFGVRHTLPIHWAGDFNELQDVEITIRDIQFGVGLVPGDAPKPQGIPLAGLSTKLDALAMYMSSIEIPSSPYVDNLNSIRSGEQYFEKVGCQECHFPPLYTDLKVHDVGTGTLEFERNNHVDSSGFDTPSLRGLWLTAPYLHDGSAATLEETLKAGTVHNIFETLSSNQLRELIAFLNSL